MFDLEKVCKLSTPIFVRNLPSQVKFTGLSSPKLSEYRNHRDSLETYRFRDCLPHILFQEVWTPRTLYLGLFCSLPGVLLSESPSLAQLQRLYSCMKTSLLLYIFHLNGLLTVGPRKSIMNRVSIMPAYYSCLPVC